jgi:hypothetical protein
MSEIVTMSFDSEILNRIKKCAKRLGITETDFVEFSAIKCSADLEALDKILVNTSLRDQLRDVLELRRLGVLTAEAFALEVEQFLEMATDDAWTAEA